MKLMNTNYIDTSDNKLNNSDMQTNHFIFKNKFNIKANALIILSIFLAYYAGGCATEYVVGGYRHSDMSNSPYRPLILEQANKLAMSTKPGDWKTAAEYYGSININFEG